MAKKLLKHSFSLLHADYVKLNHKWNYANIVSPYYRLYYIDGGEGLISSERDSVSLESGYLYLIPSFTLCSLKCSQYLSQYFIQFFEESPDGISLFGNNRRVMKVKALDVDADVFKRLLQLNPGRGINRSDNPSVYEKNVYYKEYQELNNLQSLPAYMETQGIILQLLSKFLTADTFSLASGIVPSSILEAISYIQLKLKTELTVQQLAKRANLHPDYFSRLFMQHTGERPLAFIHQKRVERAQYLITTSNMPFNQIAEEAGFENQPYFARIFKKVTGITPGEYRKQSRNAS